MLTPQDIEKKAFKISFRGYNATEVDDFLQEICDSYQEIYESNKKISDDSERLSQAVGQYKSMEETITDAKRIASRSADEIESDAKEKAKMIVKNAELTAKAIIAGAEQQIAAESYRLENIKREVEVYKSKIIELLNAQLSVLKGYPQSGSVDVSSHRQQMWNRMDAEKPKTAKNDDVSKGKPVDFIEKKEKTHRIDSLNEFGDTADLKTKKETETAELPCVTVDDEGKYIVTEK